MILTFYILLAKASCINISSKKPYNESENQNIEKLNPISFSSENKDFMKNKNASADENLLDDIDPNSSKKNPTNDDPLKKLEKMFRDIKLATHMVSVEIFRTQLLDSLYPSTDENKISRLNYYSKISAFDEYLKNSIDENFLKLFNENKKNIKEEKIKIYDEALSNYVTTKKNYFKLLQTPKNLLDNYDPELFKGQIIIEINDLFIPDSQKYSEIP